MFNVCLNLYMKFRNYIINIIRSRNIPPEKWKKTIIIRKILRIFLVVLPLLLYCISALIIWIKIDMTKIFNIIFIVIAIAGFIGLLYLILKFKKIIKDCIEQDYKNHFKNIGLVNKQNNAPVYRKMQYDADNVRQEIYYFDDVDVDYSKFFEPIVIRGLRNIFKGYVRPDVGSKYGQFELYVKPTNKASCLNLTINDTWLIENCIHIGIFGASGSGKTFGIAFLINLYCDYAEANNIDMEIILCDQKLTFAEKLGVENSKSFHYGEDVYYAIEEIYKEFEQIKLNHDGKRRIIVCDEYITLIDKLDKKRAERLKFLLGVLIFESREYNYTFIIARTSTDTQKDFRQVCVHHLQINFYLVILLLLNKK